MRKIAFASIVVLLFSMVLSAKGNMNKENWEPVKINGHLQVKGRYLCNEHADTISLRGVSYGWHNLWPWFYNANTVKWLKNDWKCSVLRAAMGAYSDVEDGYMVNPEFALNCVEKVIKASIKENIYVIIDWHTHEFYPEEAKKFFATMARKYGKNPHVIYEVFNEPTHLHHWPEVKNYAIDVIKEIRKYDPDNIIIVGTPSWDQHVDVAAEDPIIGFDNIMYSLHYYAASHKEDHRKRVVKALEKNLPIFVTESAGVEHTGNGYLDLEEWDVWVKFLEKNRISWVNWSISNKNETCSMILPRGSFFGGWNSDVIKPSGQKSREYIRFYNTTDKVYENLK